jgi:heat shock protein HslJ
MGFVMAGSFSTGAWSVAKRLPFLCVIMTAAGLGGCASETSSISPGPAPSLGPLTALQGEWKIDTVNGQALETRTERAVTFTSRRLSGNVGCTSFSAAFVVSQDALRSSKIAVRRHHCAAGSLDELAVALFYETLVIHVDGDVLQLLNPPSELTMRRVKH